MPRLVFNLRRSFQVGRELPEDACDPGTLTNAFERLGGSASQTSASRRETVTQ